MSGDRNAVPVMRPAACRGAAGQGWVTFNRNHAHGGRICDAFENRQSRALRDHPPSILTLDRSRPSVFSRTGPERMPAP